MTVISKRTKTQLKIAGVGVAFAAAAAIGIRSTHVDQISPHLEKEYADSLYTSLKRQAVGIVATKGRPTHAVLGMVMLERAKPYATYITHKGKNIPLFLDSEHLAAYSVQLNAYIEAKKTTGRKNIFWVQDVIQVFYSKSDKVMMPSNYMLSDVVYRLGSLKLEGSTWRLLTEHSKDKIWNITQTTLKLPEIKGSGIVLSKSGSYMNVTDPAKFSVPINKALFMDEHVSGGKIIVDFEVAPVKKENGNAEVQRRTKVIFDSIRIGRKGEFASASFRFNKVHDFALVVGGMGDHGSVEFAKISGRFSIYRMDKKGRFVGFESYAHNDHSTAEWAKNIKAVPDSESANTVSLELVGSRPN